MQHKNSQRKAALLLVSITALLLILQSPVNARGRLHQGLLAPLHPSADMDSLLYRFFDGHGRPHWIGLDDPSCPNPPLSQAKYKIQTGEGFKELQVTLPGVGRSQVKIVLDHHSRLKVLARRQCGLFHQVPQEWYREFQVDPDVKAADISTSFENQVLRVRIQNPPEVSPLADQVTVKVHEADEGSVVVMEVSLPGVKSRFMKATLENSVLAVTAARGNRHGDDWSRQWSLPPGVSRGDITLHKADGVLNLQIRKPEKAIPSLLDLVEPLSEDAVEDSQPIVDEAIVDDSLLGPESMEEPSVPNSSSRTSPESATRRERYVFKRPPGFDSIARPDIAEAVVSDSASPFIPEEEDLEHVEL